MLSEISGSFVVTSTNKEELYKIISLNTNKSCGPNCISTKVLHLLQDQISNHLAIDLLFSTGFFFATLKAAKVISIPHKEF